MWGTQKKCITPKRHGTDFPMPLSSLCLFFAPLRLCEKYGTKGQCVFYESLKLKTCFNGLQRSIQHLFFACQPLFQNSLDILKRTKQVLSVFNGF